MLKPESEQGKHYPWRSQPFPQCCQDRQGVSHCWTVTQGPDVWLQSVLTSFLTLNKPHLIFKPPCPHLSNELVGHCEISAHIELQQASAPRICDNPWLEQVGLSTADSQAFLDGLEPILQSVVQTRAAARRAPSSEGGEVCPFVSLGKE